ncbi:MAG: hypothetical protein ACLQGP_05220, partial [Isosphaeraceae bacterium]
MKLPLGLSPNDLTLSIDLIPPRYGHGNCTKKASRIDAMTVSGQQFRNSAVFEKPRRIQGLDLAGFTVLWAGGVVGEALSGGGRP